MHRRLLRQVLPPDLSQRTGEPLHILEAASGHADALQRALLSLGIPPRGLRISLLDRSLQHLPGPRDWQTSLPAPRLLTGDALQIPLPDASVDVVSCCLFTHHLDEAELRTFIQESLRVARVALFINDLERTRIHYLLSRLFSLVDPSRLSRHDGPVSVRRSYTRAELQSVLGATGCRFQVERGYLYRMGGIVWKGVR